MINGTPKYTFVERNELSNEIESYFVSKDGVLLFLGYSKSGKTVFRKKHIKDEMFKSVVYRANNKSKISNLYTEISRQLKLNQLTTSQQELTLHIENEGETQIGNENIGHVRERQSANITSGSNATYSYPLSECNVNFLCEKLSGENALIIIEDYHLVDQDFNKQLSEDLKHFLDEGILFLLIGIPGSPNRSLRNNPDLAGRMKHITFDYLSKDEVTEIITKGARLLNIEFTQEVIDEIIKCSMKNAYLVQHICRQVLTDKGILKRSKTIFEISDTNDVHAACKNIAKILDLDYGNIYKTIASGSRAQQKHTAFNQYEEILKAIKHFTIKDIEAGIDHKQIANIAWNNIPQEKRVRYIYPITPTKARAHLRAQLTLK